MIRIPVSVTSDFVCPWCFIGERRLARAAACFAEETAGEFRLDINWKPFELNPAMPAEGMDRRAYRQAKFGSWEYSKRLDAQVSEAGQQDGIIFNYDRIARTPNTRRAHRLVWWASRNGSDVAQLVECLFHAYFVDARDIGSPAVLAELAGAVGLHRETVAVLLDTAEGTAEIGAAETDAHRRGITGVPHFTIGAIEFSGAQRMENMIDALRRAAAGVSV